MKNNLTELDSAFTEHYKELLQIQKNLYKQYETYDFDLSKNEITEAVRERMTAFWHFNFNNTHEVLKRNVTTPAADFFTETCMLFFKAYFEQRYDCIVKSEKSIVKTRKAVRPDLSIWDKEEKTLIAAIELKVNNGWKRDVMDAHLAERESIIKAHDQNIFFGVISFWNFFSTTGDNWRTKYVGLQTYDPDNMHPRTNGLVEDIMRAIEEKLRLLNLEILKPEISDVN